MARIGINASFLRKQNTGIGQVTLNFLRKLSEFESEKLKVHKTENEFILYLEEDIKLDLPENFKKKVFLPKFYKRDDIFRAIWWQKCMLPRHAKKDKCDVFLSMYQNATIMPRKIAHVMVVHDIILELFPNYLNNWRKKLFWRLTKKAIKKTDKIVSVSKRTEKDLVQYLDIDPSKISVSYIATDEIFNREVSGQENKRVLSKYDLEKGYIYTGGGVEVRKNMEGTIRAYKILLDSTKDMFSKIKMENFPPLVISGKLMPELVPLATDVKSLVDSMGLEKNVRLLGFVPQEDLPALYKNSIMFSFPSFYEGFGLPVLEAMTQGVPVLTSKRSSLPEVGADAVLYCNPDEVEDIALVMKNLLMRIELREALSEKGKKRSEYFSWKKFTEKMTNIVLEEYFAKNKKGRK